MISVIHGVIIRETAWKMSDTAINKKPLIFSTINPDEIEPAMKATARQIKMVDITCADVPVINWRSGNTGPIILRLRP